MTRIHATAIVDPRAELADDVEVGPYSIIGPDVTIGAGTWIGPHVVISGPTVIGQRNRIFQFASLGTECQDKKYRGEPTRLEVGDDNVIRESCTLHRGTVQDVGLTKVGSRNLLMVNTHLAHDVVVGNDNIIANNAGIAGHVNIGDFVIIGGNSGIHQFCRIGSYAMLGGGTTLFKDIPAFVMASGNPAVARGMNFEGMKRKGWSSETVNTLRKAYKIVYRDGLTLEAAYPLLDALAADVPEVNIFIDSLRASTRGIAR
ncbi:acyl-ACP--UDP-N-acetylglucosamine O-acyltransferase [Amnimonas aquatica]|uniref:Acyl-[acyl-carrier-protein]--UDP-N-acetylglucosamine O-acyltransferase n=1 Tax=Amnimonas aquatica TaxID=2094561 RepID=A0A2P6AU54_9GAMM|nr:acyl-ACP--UDP-N-acetylglucosamine O-acyltransferase [Amnimonas aquatica]PQA49368.1 acyl-[acyl-carrier-protein]--UDP-N-acetylglucosamine O-acyltransferase [Amnimonas aquatica]